MNILKCIFCGGEIDILNEDRSSFKKVKCKKCGFTNSTVKEVKQPEIFTILRKKHIDV